MFFSDVRKLFYKDVEGDNNLAAVANSADDDANTTGAVNHLEKTQHQVEKEPDQRRVRQVDANGHATRFDYGDSDAAPPTQIAFADGLCFDFHYSETGTLETFFADDTPMADYRINPDSGNWKVDFADGTSAEYVLDDGRIISAKNASGTVTLIYDKNGLIISETFQGRTVTYHRNETGHLIGLTTPFGQIIHYKRDRNNRVSCIKDWADQEIRLQYTAGGAMESMVYPNGTCLTQLATAESLPAELRLTSRGAGKTIFHKKYQRDHLSRITRISNGDRETTYTYDEEGRLTKAESNHPDGINEAFVIDAKANRLSDRHSQYWINPADRIDWAAETEFIYDNLGNLTEGACPRGQAQYRYAGLNCLTSLATGSQRAQYRYDALGRRVGKKVDGVTTRYFWAGDQLLHEVQRQPTSDKNPTTVTDYLFFPGLPALLAIRQGQRTLWAAFGHRYEVLCLTAKNGRPVWQAEYDSFGQAHIEKGRDIFQPFRLSGQYWDMESGLHYSLNRYYDPGLGRYLSITPHFLESGSDNFYGYGNGDPVNRMNADIEVVRRAPILLDDTKAAHINDHGETVQQDMDVPGKECFSIAKTALLGDVTDALYNGLKRSKKTSASDGGIAHVAPPPKPVGRTQTPGELTGNPGPIKKSRRPKNISTKVIKLKNSNKTALPRSASGSDMTSVSAGSEAPQRAPSPRSRAIAKLPTINTTRRPQKTKKVFASKPDPDQKRNPDHRSDRRKGIITHTCMECGQINALTGEVILARTDFELAGRIPLTWTCYYQSQNKYTGLLGRGWQTPADARLDIDHDASIYFFDGSPYGIRFEALPTIAAIMDPASGAMLNETQEHYQVRLKSGLTYHFLKKRSHTQFHVVRINDRHDNFISFDREDNQLTRIRDSSDQCIHVRSKEGRLLSMDLQGIPIARYHYADDLLAGAMDALGHQKSYHYSNGVMVRHMDKNKHAFYFKYADGGRCTRCWDDSGIGEYQFDHRPDHGRIEVTNPIGHKKFYAYDRSRRTFKEYDHIGATVTHDYDELGRLAAFTDPLNRITAYEYDGTGHIIGITQPDGGGIGLTYSDHHRSVKVVDAEGNQWERRFDEQDRIREQVSPSGDRIQYAYNRQGDLEAVTEEGITTTFGHDKRGLVNSVVHGENNPRHIQRDIMGNTTAVIDSGGRATRYVYDKKCRLIQSVQPSGVSQTFDWDPEDNLLVHTDPNGRQTRFEYGSGDKIVRRINPDDTFVAYQYDIEDNLTRIINEREMSHHYIYDHVGRVVAQADYFGNSSRYEYDGAGQLIQSTGPLEKTITYTYDPLGRLETRTLNDEGQAFYHWDANGNLISFQSPDILVERFYDVAGRLSNERKGGVAIDYQYDKNGRRTQRTTGQLNRVGYHYDGTGAVSKIQVNDQPPIAIKRNDRGQITDEHFSGSLHRTYSYDQDGLLTCQIISAAAGEIERRYSYDGAGNLIAKQDSHKGDWRFSYDAMDRITEATDPEGQTYGLSYDPCGDLLDHQTDTSQGLRCALYRGTRYHYDAAGNLVQLIDGDVTYHLDWDELHQLSTIRIGDDVKITMTYDALGRRHTKSVNGKTTLYHWEDDALILEQSEGGAAREYVYYPGTRRPLAMIDEKGRVYYYHNDINGLPQELTRPNGDIVWAADYNALGRANQLLVDAVPQPLRLPGQYFDEESGLSYDGRRYFDPVICAYISPDPKGLSESENAYAYAPNVWSQIDTMGFCKSLLKKRSLRKRHIDIKKACVSTMGTIPVPQKGDHCFAGRQPNTRLRQCIPTSGYPV